MLILASQSPRRRELLDQAGIAHRVLPVAVDEAHLPGEVPAVYVERLARAKALAGLAAAGAGPVLGADTAVVLDDAVLGKPGTPERAREQLTRASGRCVRFLTGLCLLDAASDEARVLVEPFTVHFRELDAARIARYVDAEQPYDCAGSFKSEGLGITLFTRLEGDDPNSLIGLPLIRLVDLLAERGVALP